MIPLSPDANRKYGAMSASASKISIAVDDLDKEGNSLQANDAELTRDDNSIANSVKTTEYEPMQGRRPRSVRQKKNKVDQISR